MVRQPSRTVCPTLAPPRTPCLVAHGTFGALVPAFEKRSEARPSRASAIALRPPRLTDEAAIVRC
eukprot:2026949-Prymnesium_polylepis.1